MGERSDEDEEERKGESFGGCEKEWGKRGVVGSEESLRKVFLW